MLSPADLDHISSTLSLVNRELWLLTAANGPRRGGLVATFVFQASIDRERPVLLTALGPNHFTTSLVQTSRAFAAHLLRPDQVELAWNFAKDSGHERDKLAGLELETSRTGAPILKESLAWCDCQVFAQYDAGDRLYFWADIVAASQGSPLAPRGTSSSLSPAPATPLCEQEFFRQLSPDQRQILIAARDKDVLSLRPKHQHWRESLPA
jgi:flavin reductase (DIM6/NTAB) family NADH-FMN oxidoreductase RutF